MLRTHTRIVPVFGMLLAFTLIAAAASAQVSDQPRPEQPGAQAPSQPRPQPGAPAQPSPGAPSAQAKPQAQTARGELSAIDATAKMLTIKPTDGAEQKFQYNDDTKVTGARGGVAGLATQSGKQIVVHFNMQGANRVATEIEVQDDSKGGAAPAAPGAPGGAPREPGGREPGGAPGDRK
ncbi:MAG TPA: hypothetical protein VFB92_01255 [Vicinamibacterales bacterium]|jgi:hypothetical protein|nr:hypothetical protein [Vicinamibacterales bacterium]